MTTVSELTNDKSICQVMDYQGDLFISGDLDGVVLLLTNGISDYNRDVFFCGDLSVASVTLIGIRYTETVSEVQQQVKQQFIFEQKQVQIVL